MRPTVKLDSVLKAVMKFEAETGKSLSSYADKILIQPDWVHLSDVSEYEVGHTIEIADCKYSIVEVDQDAKRLLVVPKLK